MRTNLSVEDLGDLLELPLVATLATYRSNGDVLLSPVWFEWQDAGFNLIVGRKDFKTQHIRRDPRASIAVYENVFPLRGLELRGNGTLFTKGLHELRNRIWQRYAGKDAPGSIDAEIGLRIKGTVRAWDFADGL
jgi:pyridoxamine 5'-phosphate oxidase-like protein